MSEDKTYFAKELSDELIKKISSQYDKREAFEIISILFYDMFQLTKTDILTNKSFLIDAHQKHVLEQSIERLKDNEPIQHITNTAYFYDLKFKVNKHVLIPRQETEELVALILKDFKDTPDLSILDIGAGSGCISITLAKHLLNPSILAIDCSENAFDVMKTNAYRHKVKLSYLNTDIITDKIELGEQKFDIVVSNPPYITEEEKNEMHENVLQHEPHLALFVPNDDPLLFYRTIAQKGKILLQPGGKLYFEINQYFGPETKELVKNIGYQEVKLVQDLNGNDRMISATLE